MCVCVCVCVCTSVALETLCVCVYVCVCFGGEGPERERAGEQDIFCRMKQSFTSPKSVPTQFLVGQGNLFCFRCSALWSKTTGNPHPRQQIQFLKTSCTSGTVAVIHPPPPTPLTEHLKAWCRVEELALPTRAIQLSGEVLSTDEAPSAELLEAEAAHRTRNSHRLFKAAPTTPCICRELQLETGVS